ncbi:MAG: cupredoxin domain-containing protein [Nanoarchaeota archaeon]|nr:cupredoxin domain-containing protein [Nanoarchaeota archaeon]
MKKIILILIAFLLIISACSPEKNDTSNNPLQGAVQEFKITAKQFAFEPETIEIHKGDRVRLIVTSLDLPHGFSILEYGINERLNPGEPVAIEFTADQEGEFTMFCSLYCGSEHSEMKGKMIVR